MAVKSSQQWEVDDVGADNEERGLNVDVGKRGFQSDGDTDDEDRELQVAYEMGLLKPGLNIMKTEVVEKQPAINDVKGLKACLEKLNMKTEWVERLDMKNALAPLAPELHLQMEEHKAKREKQINHTLVHSGKKGKIPGLITSVENDPVHNDFKRETLFHRQAQAAVLEAIPKLNALNIPTKRPEDYFAQMAKTDEHMKKVRQSLISKQQVQERVDKVRKLRELKKFSRQVAIETRLAKESQKKEMLDKVKQFRKGKINSLSFLDDDNKPSKKALKKRANKEKKYGFGGQKKRSKWNTKESCDDMSDLPGKKNHPKKLPVGKKNRKLRTHIKNKSFGKKKNAK